MHFQFLGFDINACHGHVVTLGHFSDCIVVTLLMSMCMLDLYLCIRRCVCMLYACTQVPAAIETVCVYIMCMYTY